MSPVRAIVASRSLAPRLRYASIVAEFDFLVSIVSDVMGSFASCLALALRPPVYHPNARINLSECVRSRLGLANLGSVSRAVPLFAVSVTNFPSLQPNVFESDVLDSRTSFYHR